MNVTQKIQTTTETDKEIVATVIGYYDALFYVDGKYKLYGLGSLAAFVVLLVLGDVVPYSGPLICLSLLPALPTLLADLGILAHGNEKRKEKVWRWRLKVEILYHKIPGCGIFARGLPVSANDVAGLEEKANNWAKAASLREIGMQEILKRRTVDFGNLVVFKALQLPGMRQAGKDAEAKKQLDEVLNMAAQHCAERPIQLGHCQSVCAIELAEQGQFEAAIETAKKAIDFISAVDIDTQPLKLAQQLHALACGISNLGYIYRSGGWYEEACACFERAYAIRTSGYGQRKDLSSLVDLTNKLAATYLWANNEAESTAWMVVAEKLIVKDAAALTQEVIDAVQVTMEYRKIKAKIPLPDEILILKYAQSEQWRPFSWRFENLVMVAEYYRSIGNLAQSKRYFEQAYALVEDSNPGRDRWIERIKQCEHSVGVPEI